MNKILCIGHASYDITFPLDNFPEENTKNRLKEKIECGGGPASNAAYLLGKWGANTYFAGALGNDIYGVRIKEEYNDIGVNIDYVETKYNFDTTLALILANKSNGSRTIFSYRNEGLKLDAMELDIVPDYILIDGQEPVLSLNMIKKYPDAISVIDAGRNTDVIVSLSKEVNYLICSKDFAESYTKKKMDYNLFETLEEVYSILEKDFSKQIIVITLEDKGCLYKNNGKVEIIPSIKVEAVDSTGAGDIFHGAFVYAINNKYQLKDALLFANITGALSVRHVGGRYSVPDLKEVMDIYEKNK